MGEQQAALLLIVKKIVNVVFDIKHNPIKLTASTLLKALN